MSPKTVMFAATASIMLALDQLSKIWVRANLAEHEERSIIPQFLSLAHAKNKGAAFSALDSFEYRYWVFYAFTAVAVVVIVQGLRQLKSTDRFQSAAMGFIFSGAIGNFIDRVMRGEVTDMVKVYAGMEPLKSWLRANGPGHTNVYPIWNIADAAIVIGVGMFAISYWLEKKETADAPTGKPAAGSAAAE